MKQFTFRPEDATCHGQWSDISIGLLVLEQQVPPLPPDDVMNGMFVIVYKVAVFY